MQYRKNIAKKRKMNIANFIKIYILIYIHISYVTRMTQNKNDLIMQDGRVVDKNLCVVFPTSRFPYLTLCPRQCKWKVATTYLAIRTKNN